jgi:hypothetical protein
MHYMGGAGMYNDRSKKRMVMNRYAMVVRDGTALTRQGIILERCPEQ